MGDWRAKIDEQLERNLAKIQQEEQRRSRKQEEEKQRAAAKAAAEWNNKLRDHQSKFRCHICRRSSSGPHEMNVSRTYPGNAQEGSYYEHVVDWKSPMDLYRCDRCNKWTCSDDLHRGVCRRHA
jgi:hypothetical protein